jgi:hypothetical protein
VIPEANAQRSTPNVEVRIHYKRLPGEAHSDGGTDQKQTRSSSPGQTKKMTNVLRNVIAIAILTINGKGGVVVGFLADCWKEESPIIFVYSRRLRASV